MKVIIVHASAGAGHTKAAEAIQEYLINYCPGVESRLVDVLDGAGSFYKFCYKRGYNYLIRRAVWLWAAAFWLTNFKPLRFLSRRLTRISNLSNTRSFIRFLIEENPDYILSTHFLPSEIAANLKNSKKITSRLVTVITDFGVHPFWVNKGTDLYVVASSATKAALILEGVAEENIKDFGIPVKEKFLKTHDRKALSLRIGIDTNKFTVLIMTGSFGIGPIEELADILCKDVQVLVVCALNKKLYECLEAKHLSNVKVYGFVDNSDELMAVSDLIITKPGGLSISEILNMELVPIFISPIPGQERENVSVLSKFGIGFLPRSTKDIREIVMDLKANPDKFKGLLEKIRGLKKPDCLKDIYNVICQSSGRPSS